MPANCPRCTPRANSRAAPPQWRGRLFENRIERWASWGYYLLDITVAFPPSPNPSLHYEPNGGRGKRAQAESVCYDRDAGKRHGGRSDYRAEQTEGRQRDSERVVNEREEEILFDGFHRRAAEENRVRHTMQIAAH